MILSDFFKNIRDDDHPQLRAYKSKRDTTCFGLLDRDYREGKKDGKRAPSAGVVSLNLIQSEEELDRNETRSAVQQNIQEKKTKVVQLQALEQGQERQIEELRSVGALLPEPQALCLMKSGQRMIFFACVLMAIEIAGLYAVAKTIFENGFIQALAIAFLLSSSIAVGVHLLLSKLSDRATKTTRVVFICAGLLLAVTGLIGFVFLRRSTLDAQLTEEWNLASIGLGNLLLMIGLTLGVPLIAGSLFDDAHRKLLQAKNSIRLYISRAELAKERGSLELIIEAIQVFDSNLDGICEKIVATRKGRYLRGFCRKNKDGLAVLKTGHSNSSWPSQNRSEA